MIQFNNTYVFIFCLRKVILHYQWIITQCIFNQIINDKSGTWFQVLLIEPCDKIINILSQVDFVNGKIAYNPHYTNNESHVLLDSRFTLNENRGSVQIELIETKCQRKDTEIFK